MKKILSFGFLSVLFALPFVTNGASVTINAIPTVSGNSVVLGGTASYTAPETLHIYLNSTEIASFTSGNSSWQVIQSLNYKADNTVRADVQNNLGVVISSVEQSFKMSSGGGNPHLVMQSWGLTGKDTPKVAIGTTVTDRYGFTGYCDLWMPYYLGCNDVSNTEWYLSDVVKYLLQR